MAATVSQLQDLLWKTETPNKRMPNAIVQKLWNEVDSKEGFIKAMQCMFEHMVSRSFERLFLGYLFTILLFSLDRIISPNTLITFYYLIPLQAKQVGR